MFKEETLVSIQIGVMRLPPSVIGRWNFLPIHATLYPSKKCRQNSVATGPQHLAPDLTRSAHFLDTRRADQVEVTLPGMA